MEQLSAIAALLRTPRRITITTHQRPDGDAMGSALGLFHFLHALGHKCQVVTPTDYPDFFRWMPGCDAVMVGPDDPDRANWAFEGADLIFLLDLNVPERIAEFAPAMLRSSATRIMIDHHLDPQDFVDHQYVDNTASSTAELVYRLIQHMGEDEKINGDIAQCLYTGLMTDTGSFRFSSTTPAVHQMAGRMIAAGIDVPAIHDAIFATSTPERLRFIGYALSNCLHHLPELRTAYIKLDKAVFRQFNVKSGDTEGLVGYAMSIIGVELAIVMTEQDGIIKLSIRSRNGVSSSALAGEFSGGGHFYASGGRSSQSMEDTEKRLLERLVTYMAPSATS